MQFLVYQLNVYRKPVLTITSVKNLHDHPNSEKNTLKRFEFDSVKFSTNSNDSSDVRLEIREAANSQKLQTAFGNYSRNVGFAKNNEKSNSFDYMRNATLNSLHHLKNVTSGDTGSSEFEKQKMFVDSDSEAEIVYLDLSSPSKSQTNIEESKNDYQNKDRTANSKINEQIDHLTTIRDKDHKDWSILH